MGEGIIVCSAPLERLMTDRLVSFTWSDNEKSNRGTLRYIKNVEDWIFIWTVDQHSHGLPGPSFLMSMTDKHSRWATLQWLHLAAAGPTSPWSPALWQDMLCFRVGLCPRTGPFGDWWLSDISRLIKGSARSTVTEHVVEANTSRQRRAHWQGLRSLLEKPAEDFMSPGCLCLHPLFATVIHFPLAPFSPFFSSFHEPPPHARLDLCTGAGPLLGLQTTWERCGSEFADYWLLKHTLKEREKESTVASCGLSRSSLLGRVAGGLLFWPINFAIIFFIRSLGKAENKLAPKGQMATSNCTHAKWYIII